MNVLDWVVLVGVLAYPLLFAYAYRGYRVGSRTERSFVRSAGLGLPGFAVLLQQAGDRFLSSPADDILALFSLVVLLGGFYALYLGYWRDEYEDATHDAADSGE